MDGLPALACGSCGSIAGLSVRAQTGERVSARREPIGHPSAGYVYFAYNGKLTKLRELKLTIRQGEESCELLIRK